MPSVCSAGDQIQSFVHARQTLLPTHAAFPAPFSDSQSTDTGAAERLLVGTHAISSPKE